MFYTASGLHDNMIGRLAPLNRFILQKFAFPIVERSSASQFWSLYKKLNALQNADLASQQQYQRAKLADLLRFAAETTPQWRDLFAGNNIQISQINADTALDALKKLPVTTKASYSTGFPDRVTAQPKHDNWQYLSSAGTTDRMTVVTDFKKRDYLRAAEHLNLNLAVSQPLGIPTLDIPPSACNVVCGFADNGPERLSEYLVWAIRQNKLFHASVRSDIRGRVERQIVLKRHTLAPIPASGWEQMCEHLDDCLDYMQAQNTQLLRALPQFLFWLARRARQRDMTFDAIKAILPYGGLASEQMIKQIQNSFGARFVNVYGTGEVGAIGCARDESQHIDIYAGLVYLELLDDQHQPVEVGQVGNVVITDLNNKAMPIIRYANGDIGCLHNKQDGRQQLELLGRKSESFINMAGQRVTARGLQDLFFKYPGILNFKVEQTSQTLFKASIVLDEKVANGEQYSMAVDRHCLAQELQQLLACSAVPKIKISQFIQPESSGKYLSLKLKTSTAMQNCKL